MIRIQEALGVLAANEVGFVIVGGVAATLHGSARATFDLDTCYCRQPANLNPLGGGPSS